jgi:methylenetetrahydrofolate dehydrogenase (NADP+)/methenyltetrahydrofolate cyclohydrolase
VAAHLLDGKAIAATLRARLAAQVAVLPYRPCLTVILVGDNAASAVYVRSKDRAARDAGMEARTIRLPQDTDQATLLATIAALNADDAVDAILVQLPLPPQIDAARVLEAVDPAKDVDGFHPVNVGRLQEGRALLAPCTPRGVMKLLEEACASSGQSLNGARALVLGRSAIVGKPVAAMLLAANATVTVAHSRTRDLAGECRRADILVAAVGQPEMVRGDWVKDGAVVIDVGINRLADGRLVGDCATAECAIRASAITPVPGGVGPMTIACLLENTLLAATARRSRTAP